MFIYKHSINCFFFFLTFRQRKLEWGINFYSFAQVYSAAVRSSKMVF